MKHLLKSLFLKVEASYKVNANPTTADVVLAENVEINPLEMQTDDNTPVSNKFGSNAKIVGAVWSTVQFDVVIGGGGTPVGAEGGVPNYDAVLRAGAMARVINPALSIEYNIIDSGEESLSAVYQVDTARFALLGVRGDLEWIFEAGKAPRMRFVGLGLRVPMTDAPRIIDNLPVKPRPLPMTNSNTLVRLANSYDMRCRALNIKLGNKIEYINRSGQEEVILADRMSGGSISFELPSLATADFLGSNGFCTRATETTLYVLFGELSPSGTKTSWWMDQMQLLNPRMSGDKGTTMLTCDIHLVKNRLQFTCL